MAVLTKHQQIKNKIHYPQSKCLEKISLIYYRAEFCLDPVFR